eukprot:647145-Pleurochrysis_carterae.AAC.6
MSSGALTVASLIAENCSVAKAYVKQAMLSFAGLFLLLEFIDESPSKTLQKLSTDTPNLITIRLAASWR